MCKQYLHKKKLDTFRWKLDEMSYEEMGLDLNQNFICFPFPDRPEKKAFRMKAGIESGPVALCVLMFFKSLWTPFQSILISGMFGVVLLPLSGMLVRSSSVNTDLNCSLRMFALDCVSL